MVTLNTDIKISQEQISDMKHCIGLDSYSKFKKKQGVKHYEAYRNYYANGYNINESLEELVTLGLMDTWTKQMGESGTYFYYCVSEKGLEYLESLFDIKITERD